MKASSNYNIFCIPNTKLSSTKDSQESTQPSTPFICDDNLTERVAKRLTKQYNLQFSSHKKYAKISTLPLDCIIGYVYSDKGEGGDNSLTYEQALSYEQAVKLLVKQVL